VFFYWAPGVVTVGLWYYSLVYRKWHHCSQRHVITFRSFVLSQRPIVEAPFISKYDAGRSGESLCAIPTSKVSLSHVLACKSLLAAFNIIVNITYFSPCRLTLLTILYPRSSHQHVLAFHFGFESSVSGSCHHLIYTHWCSLPRSLDVELDAVLSSGSLRCDMKGCGCV
jgi:hypothetical protein